MHAKLQMMNWCNWCEGSSCVKFSVQERYVGLQNKNSCVLFHYDAQISREVHRSLTSNTRQTSDQVQADSIELKLKIND